MIDIDDEWFEEAEALKAERNAELDDSSTEQCTIEEIEEDARADEQREDVYAPVAGPYYVKRPPVYFDPPPPPKPDYDPQRPTGPRPSSFGRVTGFKKLSNRGL